MAGPQQHVPGGADRRGDARHGPHGVQLAGVLAGPAAHPRRHAHPRPAHHCVSTTHCYRHTHNYFYQYSVLKQFCGKCTLAPLKHLS